jgi:hypothetical protein
MTMLCLTEYVSGRSRILQMRKASADHMKMDKEDNTDA